MALNWAICIAVAAAIHQVQFVVVSEDIRLLKVAKISFDLTLWQLTSFKGFLAFLRNSDNSKLTLTSLTLLHK
jgi:hypothetical protein